MWRSKQLVHTVRFDEQRGVTFPIGMLHSDPSEAQRLHMTSAPANLGGDGRGGVGGRGRIGNRGVERAFGATSTREP